MPIRSSAAAFVPRLSRPFTLPALLEFPMVLSRRNFLQGTAAAGASLLITGTRASGKIKGANDRLRIAVAGLNGRGNAHIKGWLEQENVEIVAIIDPDRKVLARHLTSVEKLSKGKSK